MAWRRERRSGVTTAELGRLEERVKVLSEEAEGTFALEDLDP